MTIGHRIWLSRDIVQLTTNETVLIVIRQPASQRPKFAERPKNKEKNGFAHARPLKINKFKTAAERAHRLFAVEFPMFITCKIEI